MIELVPRSWKPALAELVSQARHSLLICSPYVSQAGAQVVAESITDSFGASGQLRLLTDLSPTSICVSSTDPNAVKSLSNLGSHSYIQHLPRVHAKVYIADKARAIITSGNLTHGGLITNYEYGVQVADEETVARIYSDIAEYAALGALMTADQLEVYCKIAARVRSLFDQQRRAIQRDAGVAFRRAVKDAEDELLRVRLAGGPVHSVFERTIGYLLGRDGPMTTPQLHEMISQIHPDLCGNSVDRVIRGKRFGKKWKHAVRTAQQHLRSRGLIGYAGGKWYSIG